MELSFEAKMLIGRYELSICRDMAARDRRLPGESPLVTERHRAERLKALQEYIADLEAKVALMEVNNDVQVAI